jgi:flagellar motility protein MotE (MotC chaperone)
LINGPVTGGSGDFTGCNIAGSATIGETRTIQNAVDKINSNVMPAEQLNEFNKSTEIAEQLAILCKVRADKAASLVRELMEHADLHGRTVALLERVDDSRMIELLGPEGLRPQLSARIIAALSKKRVHKLLKLLGTDKPESAAGLVERLAGMPASPDTWAGRRGAIEVLPPDRKDRRFLIRLSDSPDAIKLLKALAQLRPDMLHDLLMELSQTELRRRLRQEPAIVLATLTGVDQAALPMDHLVQELDLLDSAQIASVLRALGPERSAPWLDRMQPNRVVAALNHMVFVRAAAFLERMDHDRAALAVERMKPDRAAGCLEHIRTGTALELLQRLSIADTEWLGGVLKGMHRRLVAALLALLAWTAMDHHHHDAATRLRAALPAGWTPAPTGWPRLRVILMMRTIVGPAAQVFAHRVRSTMPLGAALRRAARDARSLWQSLQQVAGPPDYRRQRNHLAIVLALTLVVLVGVIVGGAGG